MKNTWLSPVETGIVGCSQLERIKLPQCTSSGGALLATLEEAETDAAATLLAAHQVKVLSVHAVEIGSRQEAMALQAMHIELLKKAISATKGNAERLLAKLRSNPYAQQASEDSQNKSSVQN